MEPVTEPPITSGGLVSWPTLWVAVLALTAMTATASLLVNRPAGAGGGAAGPSGHFVFICTTMICVLAAWFDAATTRIPNPLTYTAVVVGLCLSLLAAALTQAKLPAPALWLGAPTPLDALYGFGLCAAIGLACLVFAGMGGGDVKLLAALGMLLGLGKVPAVLVWALAAALPYAVLNLLVAGRLNGVCRIISLQLLCWVYLHKPAAVETPSKTHIPLALPLLVGLLLAQAFPGALGM
ncbi:MAG: prepilin peptidase [Phycisphaerae bacterium]